MYCLLCSTVFSEVALKNYPDNKMSCESCKAPLQSKITISIVRKPRPEDEINLKNKFLKVGDTYR